jgi:hypothetical protein
MRCSVNFLRTRTIIPNFILKRMYRAGSFKRAEGGVSFEIINNLGPGQLSGLNGITLNGTTYVAEQVTFIFDGIVLPAKDITESTPASFFLNQVVTVIISGDDFGAGDYTIKMDLISREAGKVTLTVQDKLAG